MTKPKKARNVLPDWVIVMKHASGKTKTVRKPGGCEAEAVRCALLDAGPHWRLMSSATRADDTSIYRT